MRVCMAFLLAMTLLQIAGFMAYANVRLDAVPASTQAAGQELLSIEQILDVLAPINVRKPNRTVERGFQDFSAWRDMMIYQKQSSNAPAANSQPTRPKSINQRAY